MSDTLDEANAVDGAQHDPARVWFLGAEGRLQARGWRCDECGAVRLPSRHPICPDCLSDRASRTDLSGHATIFSKTVVHRGFPGIPVPYTVALVDLVEGIRLRTVVVGEGAERVAIGDNVTLVPTPRAEEFEQAGLAVSPVLPSTRKEVQP
ncbi:Zn-ribbon domain-containing OB-fold protein [Rhodococcus sp. NPDC057014]|uniref:Zn-ribbon domain-containing OB-fold protein n=1 Tax=Rhodococcus sp. NPDC057014 TaxID=3346000 RepID=UPI003637F5A6